MEYAEDIYFMDGFDDAFVGELLEPSDDLLKAINNRMGGGKLMSNKKDKIRDLINSVSVKTALDELIVREAEKSNTGIITTEEELKIYHSIVTVLATDKNIELQESVTLIRRNYSVWLLTIENEVNHLYNSY